MIEWISITTYLIQTVFVAVFLFIIPGFALLSWIWDGKSQHWATQAGLAAGLSLSLYPLLFLITYVVGIQAGTALAWGIPVLAILAIGWKLLRRSSSTTVAARKQHPNDRLFDILFAVVLLALILTRLVPVRDMVAPAWGDSVHHTIITRLLVDNNGLFQSWSPYSPMESFTYHFGFHTSSAVWSWITGMPIPKSVIVTGQVLNILAILALFPIATRLSGNRWAGLGAMTVAGMLTMTPAIYVNWGRYTQLAALVILPALLWIVDVWLCDRRRPSKRNLILFIILVAGLTLSHYRVSAIAVAAVLAWTLWSLWLWRRSLAEFATRLVWLVGAALVSLLLTLPWLLTVAQGRIYSLAGKLATRSTNNPRVRADLSVWSTIPDYYHPLLLGLAIIALIVALKYRPKLGVPLALWGVLAFLITNPFLVGLPGSGTVTNFLVLVGFYVPVALLVGFLAGLLWQKLANWPYGGVAVSATLLALIFASFPQQFAVLDPSYQMVTARDTEAFQWISENVESDSLFAVNGFLAYNDSTAVGSDAGWWLPYYTLRSGMIPPILYTTETLRTGHDRQLYKSYVLDVMSTSGRPDAIHETLCQYAITHVYLGDRQGQVGFGDTQLLKPEWFQHNPDFRLLYEAGNAQVWSFDRGVCSHP